MGGRSRRIGRRAPRVRTWRRRLPSGNSATHGSGGFSRGTDPADGPAQAGTPAQESSPSAGSPDFDRNRLRNHDGKVIRSYRTSSNRLATILAKAEGANAPWRLHESGHFRGEGNEFDPCPERMGLADGNLPGESSSPHNSHSDTEIRCADHPTFKAIRQTEISA